MREIELAATIASIVGHVKVGSKKIPYFYPKSAIDQLWQSMYVPSLYV